MEFTCPPSCYWSSGGVLLLIEGLRLGRGQLFAFIYTMQMSDLGPVNQTSWGDCLPKSDRKDRENESVLRSLQNRTSPFFAE